MNLKVKAYYTVSPLFIKSALKEIIAASLKGKGLL